jgi:MipA family protein
VTFESSPKFLGWSVLPKLNLDLPSVAGSGWNMGLQSGPIYADRRGNAYFYTVEPQFATAERPAFEAPGGYAGMQVLASLSKRFDRHWVGAFVRWDSLRGAVFEDSPLVRSRHYLAAGVAVSWIFGVSERQVEVSE